MAIERKLTTITLYTMPVWVEKSRMVGRNNERRLKQVACSNSHRFTSSVHSYTCFSGIILGAGHHLHTHLIYRRVIYSHNMNLFFSFLCPSFSLGDFPQYKPPMWMMLPFIKRSESGWNNVDLHRARDRTSFPSPSLYSINKFFSFCYYRRKCI